MAVVLSPTFRLALEDDRIRFTLKLHYLSSALRVKSEWGDTQEQVTELVTRIQKKIRTRTGCRH